MQLNGIDLVDRHDRPATLQKVALRAFFVNNGEYYDPYQISGVTVFQKASNFTPSTVIDGNVISSSIPSSIILAHFGASAVTGSLNPTSYNPVDDKASTSSIYRISTGQYVCVIDAANASQNNKYNFYGSSVVVPNIISAIGDYIDCWTIKNYAGSKFVTYINDFTLYNDNFFVITQPLIFAVKNNLLNKHLTLSSIETLKIQTDVTIQNRDIDDSIRNLFKDSLITSAMIKIEKVNEDSTTLPATVQVSGFSDTSSLIDVTSDNTILLKFNTTLLATHPQVANFGGLTGTYRLIVKYSILNDTMISKPFYFTIS